MRKLTVTRLVLTVLIVGVFAGFTSAPAQAHGSGSPYWRPVYAAYILMTQWWYGGGTQCYGYTNGSHGMTQWPPEYYPRYQSFYCSDGGYSGWWHTTPWGSFTPSGTSS